MEMNIDSSIRWAASLVAFFVLTLTSLLGTGCATQAGRSGPTRPSRRLIPEAQLHGHEAVRRPLRIQVIGNHTKGEVSIYDGTEMVKTVSPGKIEMFYVRWGWRESNPQVVVGVQRDNGPITIVRFGFSLYWDSDYVSQYTPVQTEVLTLVDEGTPSAPPGLGIIRSR